MSPMKSHGLNFGMLFAAALLVMSGILLYRSILKDFSLVEISYSMVLTPFLGGVLLVTVGVYVGFYAFKRMKNT